VNFLETIALRVIQESHAVARKLHRFKVCWQHSLQVQE